MQKTCIVVPCYNEEKRLPLDEFRAFLSSQPFSVCFVNDGSTDRTIEILQELKSSYPEKVLIVDLKKNCGKAEAVRAAFLEMAERKKFDCIGYLDADLATPLIEIPALQDQFIQRPELKIVFGSRVKLLGKNIHRSFKRHYFGRVFSTIASIILKLPVYDTQCGAKFFKAELVPDLFSSPFLTRWLFDIELLARFRNKMGLEHAERFCHEYALSNWKEIGNSRLKAGDFLKVPLELYKIHRRYN